MSRDVRFIKLKYFLMIALLMGSTGNAGELADPTIPLRYEAKKDKTTEETQSLHLVSVIVGPKSKIAIINGRRYREADQVGGYRLVNIQAKEVTLTKGHTSVRLSISAIHSDEPL